MRLVSPVGVIAAAAPAPAWTPSQIANQLDWWNFADVASITSASNLISAIAGQRGVVNLTQSTGANKPKTGLHTINGHNVGNFGTAAGAGAVTFLDSSGTVSLSTTGMHLWWIGQITAFDSGSGLTILLDGDPTHRAAFFFDGDRGAGHLLSLYSGGPNYPNESTFAGDTSLHCIVANLVAGGTSTLYVDGTAYNLGAGIASTTITGLRLGQDATYPSNENRLSGYTGAAGAGSAPMGTTDLSNLLAYSQSFWGTP